MESDSIDMFIVFNVRNCDTLQKWSQVLPNPVYMPLCNVIFQVLQQKLESILP